MVLWRKVVVSKPSVWFGVDGNRYVRDRFIGVIFYSLDDVRSRRAFLFTNFGSGVSMSEALRNVNVYSKASLTTEKKVNGLIDNMAREIEKNPERYSENTDY